jgi:nucleoside-diphosphate-sugar epimerase
MKVVVTGGAGQLGTLVLANLLVDRRVKRVVCIDRRKPTLVSPKLETHVGDVRDDEALRHLAGADAVVHLAFVVTRPMAADKMRSVNVEGSRRVLQAAASASVQTVVVASSLAAYGVVHGQPEPILETTPRQASPTLAYGTHKFEVEAFLDAFEVAHPELRVVRFRPGILLGRRMGHSLGKALSQRLLIGFGEAPIPIVWDEDVADAFTQVLWKNARGAFNLAAEAPLTPEHLAQAGGFRFVRAPARARQLAETWARVAPGLGVSAVDPGWLDVTGIRLIASSERARRELDWKPRALTCADVIRRFAEEVPERIDPRILLFMGFVGQAGRRASESSLTTEVKAINARVHVEVTGRRGGDFEVTIVAGRVSVRRGVPRPPSTIVTLSAAVFLDVLAGTVDLTTAQMTGRVRVSGDPLGGWMLSTIVTAFQHSNQAPGARGLVARGLRELFRLGHTMPGGRKFP